MISHLIFKQIRIVQKQLVQTLFRVHQSWGKKNDTNGIMRLKNGGFHLKIVSFHHHETLSLRRREKNCEKLFSR